MGKTELCYCLFLLLVVAETAAVKFLPGFQGPLPFELETGYIGVGDSEEVQLFYYFIKSESNPESDPLMLWLTGGPGCSALSGLVYEIGPITFEAVEYNGSFPTMILNPYSWTKVASIIFIDSPVGTGFSYATTPEALQSDDLQASDHAYQFLRKWFADHQEFLKNPFYVTGDSYSGRVVPVITQIIAIKNEMEVEPFINLKGYSLGNPLTFEGENNYEIPYAHGMGLISDELYESLKTNCKGEYLNINPSNALCLQDVQTFKELIERIRTAHILEPDCKSTHSPPHLMFRQRRSLDEVKNPELLPALKCRDDWYVHSYHWANDGQVRDALNIRKGTIGEWKRCATLQYQKKTVISSIPYHENLSSKGYRSLIYSGDHDMNVTFRSTQAWIKSLNYSIVDDWRPWIVDNQVAGYTRSYSNRMTFATVKGAGHTAPEYKPRECLAMLRSPSNTACLQDVQTFHELLEGINIPHILEPKCEFASPRPHLLFGKRRSLDEKFHGLTNFQQLSALKCRTDWYKLSYHWADDGQVRNALNIRKGTIGKWERCASNLQYQDKTVISSIPYHENLSNKGYRSLIYSGDHDKVVNFRSTQAWIKSLNYSVVDDWRPWIVDNQFAGYTRSYSNRMTFATVKGAGHTAPEYKPRECLAMLKRWMSYQPL